MQRTKNTFEIRKRGKVRRPLSCYQSNMANRSVLASAVHPLQHYEQRALVRGVHQILQLVEARDASLGFLGGGLFLESQRVVGMPLGEGESRARADDQLVA